MELLSEEYFEWLSDEYFESLSDESDEELSLDDEDDDVSDEMLTQIRFELLADEDELLDDDEFAPSACAVSGKAAGASDSNEQHNMARTVLIRHLRYRIYRRMCSGLEPVVATNAAAGETGGRIGPRIVNY